MFGLIGRSVICWLFVRAVFLFDLDCGDPEEGDVVAAVQSEAHNVQSKKIKI